MLFEKIFKIQCPDIIWKAANCTQYVHVYRPICSVELYKEMRETHLTSLHRERSPVLHQCLRVQPQFHCVRRRFHRRFNGFCCGQLPVQHDEWTIQKMCLNCVLCKMGFRRVSHQVCKHNIVQMKDAAFNREWATSSMPIDQVNSAGSEVFFFGAKFEVKEETLMSPCIWSLNSSLSCNRLTVPTGMLRWTAGHVRSCAYMDEISWTGLKSFWLNIPS